MTTLRKPDMFGFVETICAWKIDLNLNNYGRPIDQTASLQPWLVKGPFHPLWNHWLVNVVHLRDIEGQSRPAVKDSPDMTHEFQILSLDPGDAEGSKKFREFDPDNLPQSMPFLMPPDCMVQFKCESDAKAVDILEAAIKLIMNGTASPDRDFREFWKKTIPATAACDKHSDKGMQ